MKFYGEERLRSIFIDLYREIAERLINFLIDEGVMLDISSNAYRILSARILTEGPHKLNRRAAQIEREYYGASLWYRSNFIGRGYFSEQLNEIALSAAELLTLDVKSPTIGHELRHAANDMNGERDFGSAMAKGTSQLPGRPIAYEKHQSYEEAETHSYSLRRDAQRLLSVILSDPQDNYKFFEYQLLNLAFQSSIVAERNTLITELLDQALMTGVTPTFQNLRNGTRGRFRYLAKFHLSFEGQEFEHKMDIHDAEARMVEERIAYIRSKVNYMIQLNPNYVTQFNVAQQATEILVAASTAREKAAVLEGLISISKRHFWESFCCRQRV